MGIPGITMNRRRLASMVSVAFSGRNVATRATQSRETASPTAATRRKRRRKPNRTARVEVRGTR